MEVVQSHLQLIFNVISITGVTALAITCYLLMQENHALASKLNAIPANPPEQSAVVSPKPEAAPSPDRDIRGFVTRRSQGWVAPSESQWKTS